MKTFHTLILLLIALICFGQYQPLDSFDLESGDYYVLAIFSESDPSSLRDSLGEFYVHDVNILKELNDLWKFQQEAPFYACGYHYDILICKNGEAIDGFSINLNCNTLCADGGCYDFDNDKLRFLLGKTQTFYKESKRTTIEKGRNYLNSIRNDSNLIFAPHPIWMGYEGEFNFIYDYPEGVEKYYPDFEEEIDSSLLKFSEDSILLRLKKQIQNKYPQETFELHDVGGSSTYMFVEVTSNKSLEEKFDLFRRTKHQKWKYFKPRFRTYWTKKVAKKVIESDKPKSKNYLWIGVTVILALIIGLIIRKQQA